MKRNLLCREKKREKRTLPARSFILTLLCAWGLSSPVLLNAQSQQRITLDMKQSTIEQVITQLRETTRYEFFYRVDDLPVSPLRDYSFSNATINQVMDKLTENTQLQWTFRNGAVAITLKPEPQQTQPAQAVAIDGYVYEMTDRGRGAPLAYATVGIPELGIGATTDAKGYFILKNVPQRKVTLQVKYLGFEELNREMEIRSSVTVSFELKRSDFRLENVTVTAQESHSGAATASTVSRTAMDHMQTGSLKDVMSLIPGGVIENPSLGFANLINIRMTQRSTINNASGVSSNLMNSFGTAVVVDGAPVSNDANMQVMAPTQMASNYIGQGIAAGNSPLAGADVRSISTDNISDVEIIRGVPSVEYGNLTSGAVIVNSKAGVEPLSIKFKTNPLIYQASANKGFRLGEKGGALNTGIDYARDVKDQRMSYVSYTRVTGKLLYSNTFFDNRLLSNTSLDIIYGKNNVKQNPDDEQDRSRQYSKEAGFRFNTNGTFNFQGWLRSIKYTAAVSFTDKDTYNTSMLSGRNTYSTSTVDGSIITNRLGEEIDDVYGNRITNIAAGSEQAYAYTTPVSYMQQQRVQGKEWNVFAKINANFVNNLGAAGINRLLIGVDFKTDGNRGKGFSFGTDSPPYITFPAIYASLRPVSYKDIPFIDQFGAYIEDNLMLSFGEHNIVLQAGLRYDKLPGAPLSKNEVLSPRANLIVDIIPGILSVRGGYGVTAKSPSVLFLYPDKAYYDVPYFSNGGSAGLPEENRLDIVATSVVDTQNKGLKMATNTKSEIGLDLNLKPFSLNVTGYYERLKNGYVLKQTPASTIRLSKPYYYNSVYTPDQFPRIVHYEPMDQTLFSYYNQPTNLGNIINSGVEFTLSTKRFDRIRTQFVLSGAWLRSDIYDDGYELYSAASESQLIGLYDNKAANRTVYDRITTTLRATHNIPKLGFVVTLAAQVTWLNDITGKFGDDATPAGYITTADNNIHFFSASDPYTDDKYKGIRKTDNSAVKSQTYINDYIHKPILLMNLNLTKEIRDYLKVSFFVNNMFSSHPLVGRTKRPGEYYRMNQDIFFGLDLSFIIK